MGDEATDFALGDHESFTQDVLLVDPLAVVVSLSLYRSCNLFFAGGVYDMPLYLGFTMMETELVTSDVTVWQVEG